MTCAGVLDNGPVILVLHPSDELYGADRVLLETVKALSTHDEVEVWLPTDLEYARQGLSAELDRIHIPYALVDLPVLRRAYANPRDMAAVSARAGRFLRLLAESRPAQIYVNTSALAPAIPIASALGIPSTLHVHETWGPTERRLLGPLCRPADQIVVVGEATRSALTENLRRRAVVRRHTVSAPPPDPAAVDGVRGLMSGIDAPVVLYAGRWTPGKGLAEFLAALRRTDVHLLLLGGPPPSGQTVDVAEEIARNGLQDRVHVVGEVDEVWPYIYATDAVVVPSTHPESYPTIALEAIAAGKPVLASDIGGLPEIVTPERGWLITPGDTDAWIAHLGALESRSHLQQ